MQSSTTKKEIRPIQDEVIDTDQILNQNIENHDQIDVGDAEDDDDEY